MVRLIIDTDPGQDDAAAILAAFGWENLEQCKVEALTCVAGNVPLHHTQNNARIICDWAMRSDCAVYAGADRPLLKQLLTAEEVHGKTGLDGVELHEPYTPLQEMHAAVFLAETMKNSPPKSITLCPIGPLTNLALAFALGRGYLDSIKEIVIMGGAFFEAGNVTPRADFNFFVDPIAAQSVLQSGVAIRVVPLDVTHTALTTPERMDRLRHLPNQNGRRVADILQSYARFDTQKFGLKGGPLHDPCAVACALYPEWFEFKELYLEVETSKGLFEGSCALDCNHTMGRKPNVQWAHRIDDERFFSGFIEAIATLP